MFVNKKIIERIRKRAQTGNFEPIVSERSTRNKNEKQNNTSSKESKEERSTK